MLIILILELISQKQEESKKFFLKNEEYLKNNLFSANESNYCHNKKDKFLHLAARFAAKEDLIKVTEGKLPKGVKISEIDVINNEYGAPSFNLKGKLKKLIAQMKIQQISLSLTHCDEYAISLVILQIKKKIQQNGGKKK
ncbi:MAG: holo-ACP synthase [Thermoplasmata archaeon]